MRTLWSKLEETPRLLPIPKIKPKKNVSNTRLTQICGSLEGKQMLNVVESSKKKKEEKLILEAAKGDFLQMQLKVYVWQIKM